MPTIQHALHISDLLAGKRFLLPPAGNNNNFKSTHCGFRSNQQYAVINMWWQYEMQRPGSLNPPFVHAVSHLVPISTSSARDFPNRKVSEDLEESYLVTLQLPTFVQVSEIWYLHSQGPYWLLCCSLSRENSREPWRPGVKETMSNREWSKSIQ